MPRKKRKARKQPERRISVRPVYHDKIDTEALAKALVNFALKRSDHDL